MSSLHPTRFIYVGGTFDLPHPGHFRLLGNAARLGRVIVGLNSDEFAARYKRTPILTYDERRECLLSCRWVEDVILNEGDEDSRPAILKSHANIVVHSDQWTGDSLMLQMGLTKEWLDEHGISLVYLPHTAGVSSTDLIERCRRSQP